MKRSLAIAAAMMGLFGSGFDPIEPSPTKRKSSGEDRSKIKAARKQRRKQSKRGKSK